ncbi:GNAT family N-acetyltransferase [Brachybacterium sp. FME24]|uniref:GNAT family N-acetyltransferase n=1 Tax=Brachybacterium sp. FME24 TaxID=2742605 RepID=UPI0018678CCE|nr:GNAT family N-acetyltransferase [Brachybacterium sp. FME24]
MVPSTAASALTVLPASGEDFDLLGRLLQLYFYDFSEYTGDDVDDEGSFHYAWLDTYRHEQDRYAYVVRVDGHPAGFALVRQGDPTQMAEFFVLRKYRRDGVGRRTARLLFDAHVGSWSVTQLATNPEATSFWRRAIPVPFDETVHADGKVEQTFSIEPA